MDWVIINQPKTFPYQTKHPLDLIIINRPKVFPHQTRYQIAKRVMDVGLCLLLLPLVLPLMIICAMVISIDSPGPVFFVQERIGKGGRQFRMYKFRTMHPQFDERHHRAFMKAFVNGQLGDGNGKEIYKPIRPSQVTSFGRILRKTSLDELPQLINVLKGEMSLVGPRPNVPWEVEEYRLWHHERLEALPGITGLAQVRGRSSISFDRIVKYDVEYLEKRSLALDIKILWWTLTMVLRGTAAE
jgi:lipopolysaccharide/colanic/teichoic acid biosynthesis glycosyltransferase